MARQVDVSSNIKLNKPFFTTSSKYGFIVAMITGIVGLLLGAIGLAGYFHAGTLSQISQVEAIIMMTAGGGTGTILSIIGIVGWVRFIDTHDGLIYGPKAWKIWNVTILDKVPPMPKVDLSNKDKVLLYIPHKIKFNGKELDFNLNALGEIRKKSFNNLAKAVKEKFGDKICSGWFLIDKYACHQDNYEDQQSVAKAMHCQIPPLLAVAVYNLMVSSFTGERLKNGPFRCIEKMESSNIRDDSVVLYNLPSGLDISYYYSNAEMNTFFVHTL